MYIYNHITPIRSRLSLAFACLFCSIVWKRSNYSWKLSVAEFIVKIIMVEPFHCSELYTTYLPSELHNTLFCIYSPAASTLFATQHLAVVLCVKNAFHYNLCLSYSWRSSTMFKATRGHCFHWQSSNWSRGNWPSHTAFTLLKSLRRQNKQ